MGFLLFLKQIVQKIMDVHVKVIVETLQTSMASENHAVRNSLLLYLNHVSDLRRSKVVALEVERFYWATLRQLKFRDAPYYPLP